MLQPKWCILGGSSGTHAVCVCVIHQNTELLLHAIISKTVHVNNFIDLMVCNRENRACMLGVCEKCPQDKNDLRKYIVILKSMVQMMN